jgi:outer membrane protein assembly factor BamB
VAVDEGRRYLGSQSGRTGIVALEAGTGEERWHVSTGAVTGGPVVAGDLVVVWSYHRVLAFDTDGSHRWSPNVLETDARPIAVDDQHVYVPA